MKSLLQIITETILTEAQVHDDEVVSTLNHIRDNLKFTKGSVGGLEVAASFAKDVARHDEGSPSYAQAHDNFMHSLHVLQGQNAKDDHEYNATQYAGPHADMFHTARKNVKAWVENGKFGPAGRVDYNMTAMHLKDAADQLMLAHYVANGDRRGFSSHLRNMDTNPREEIPNSVWHGWYKQGSTD